MIAWIWARTVGCPNPTCRIEMPLVRSWWLGKKKGKEAYVVPVVVDGPEGKRVRYEIGHDSQKAPGRDDGTISRTGALCVSCSTTVPLENIRSSGRRDGFGNQLVAVVAEGKRSRTYLPPPLEHEVVLGTARLDIVPPGELPDHALGFRVQAYGFERFIDLFTRRQQATLATFSSLVREAREQVMVDASSSHPGEAGERLEQGGNGPAAYADAVSTYLGFGVSKATDYHNSFCSWRSDPKNEGIGHLFSRQTIPMIWDYCEGNPLSRSSGNIRDQYEWIAKTLGRLGAGEGCLVAQLAAQQVMVGSKVISTDPPYYDNIGYADLSDFFYIWLRQSLGDVYPNLLSTLLTPKFDELVANPFRQGDASGARRFFESGFETIFARARETALADYPITVYYAFKQSESEIAGSASTGWETLLGSMVRAGWSVTATWPMRSELGNRLRSIDSNALASSIVLALRPRPVDAVTTDRRNFLAALRGELPDALRELQQGAIAPVDLPQAAIGPGMAVFTRYSAVLGDDGTPMPVREALQQINHLLDEVLAEQEGDFDSDSRFLLTWFRQHGFAAGPYGDADNLARARNASVDRLRRSGTLTSHANKVQLIAPADLPAGWDPATDPHLTVWEVVLHLARVLAADGVPAAAGIYRAVPSSLDLVLAKELTSLLFRIAEQRKDSGTAQLFNALGSAWNEIAKAATGRSIPAAAQLEFPTDTDVED